MTPAERYQQAAAILVEALDQTEAQRDAFLEQACQGDAALKAEIQRLLAEEQCLSDGFLEQPAVESIRGLAETAEPPAQIGPYRILGLLGEGGMGRVYRAEQIEPEPRIVALKVIDVHLRPQNRLRFQAECRALARLAHPNVAQMFKTGSSADGQMHVALELIEGATITAWSEEHRLSLRERVELFLGACAGLQHAHHKGILHRDLKPSNVLVTVIDGKPIAKVIDFGIARALDAPLTDGGRLTRNQILGSPAYMSPEAALLEGDVDTRADVYSLGVLLYELLLGVLPFEEASLARLLRRITEEDRPAITTRLNQLPLEQQQELARNRGLTPRTLKLQLRGDLESILVKAMARDPSARYSSPAALAADLERYLQHRPIEARSPTRWYLITRFLQRNAAATMMAALLLVALVGGLVTTTLEAQRANREAQKALESVVEAHGVTDFLVSLFKASRQGKPEPLPLTTFGLFQRAVERAETDLAHQPLAQARILQIIGEIQAEVGLLEQAQLRIARALEVRLQRLPADHPDVLDSQRELKEIRRQREACGQCKVKQP